MYGMIIYIGKNKMAKKIQKINFIDLECTAWENGKLPDGRDQREHMETIEIGIVQLDANTLEIEKKESYLIIPVEIGLSGITEYCTNLTGITQQLIIKDGLALDYALARMMSEFKTMKYEWMSWGDFDRTQMEKECKRKELQYPFKHTHTNFKYWFSLLTNQNVQRNVAGALEFLGLQFEGSPHRGVDDAYNIARMYRYIMREIKLLYAK
jgi:inhibitor of KinA sporulation pathway (predicted exonuclease)